MPKRKRKTTNKKKTSAAYRTPSISPEVMREIMAVVLVAVSLVLVVAILNMGGFLVTGIFSALRLAIGLSAYLVPFVFLLLAWMMFDPEKYELRPAGYFGFLGVFIALIGLLQVFSGSSIGGLSVAQSGNGGGMIGYWLTMAMLPILRTPATVILLLALFVVSVLMAANTKLSDIVKMIRMLLFKESGEPGEPDLKINEPAGMVINNKLPIKGTIGSVGGGKEEKAEEGALTMIEDAEWKMPSLDLLEETTTKADPGNVKENAGTIQQTLSSFGIEVTMGEVNVGPTVTQYTFKPDSGVKLNKITGLDHNLALSLAAHPIRIEAPIPGKSAVGVEIPNRATATVRLRELLMAQDQSSGKSALTFGLGRDVAGLPTYADITVMPHMLIAGATGSGKSVMINAMLMGLLYRNSPSNLKLILVDPKRVELSLYNEIPHLLTPVIVEPEKCISALKWAVAEMERRYKLFAEVGKRNVEEYNAIKQDERMPFIVIVIDELADLMALAAQDVEALIVRLAQMARATGIHLVLATQRPSVDVITGLIKANIPARIAFSVASQVDSRTILDQAGAEKLLGKGDMLFSSPEFIKPKRVQGVFVSEKEVSGLTHFLKDARAPQYNEEILTQEVRVKSGRGGVDIGDEADDPLFKEAAETVIRSGKASASLLQRRLRVGYARAARLLDILEDQGIIGPADGARPRDVLVDSLNGVSDGIHYEE
jgi:S-DNA-T family DNA segregation ATPase FtsK/SpoIIIE